MLVGYRFDFDRICVLLAMSILEFVFQILFQLFSAKVRISWPEETMHIFALHHLRAHHSGCWVQVTRMHRLAVGKVQSENGLIFHYEMIIPWLCCLLRLKCPRKRTVFEKAIFSCRSNHRHC
jgi:hypothetical protein